MNTKVKLEDDSIREWLQSIFYALLFFILFSIFFANVKVEGYSMYPTYYSNDLLLASKVSYNISEIDRGDVIVFNHDDESRGKEIILIKRVVGVEGDTIQISDGNVYLNGNKLEEPYIMGQETLGEHIYLVEEDKVFVLGDNRQNSLDSRSDSVGQIKEDEIVGKILFRFFSSSIFH